MPCGAVAALCCCTSPRAVDAVTEHRVWHLELPRHGSSSDSGHEGWHVLGRMVGALVRPSLEAGAGNCDPTPTERSGCQTRCPSAEHRAKSQTLNRQWHSPTGNVRYRTYSARHDRTTRRYDVTITVDGDGGSSPNPASGGPSPGPGSRPRELARRCTASTKFSAAYRDASECPYGHRSGLCASSGTGIR